LRLKNDLLEKLTDAKSTVKIQEKDFKFDVPEGEDLKAFWQGHGGHY